MSSSSSLLFWVVPHGPDWAIVREGQSDFVICRGSHDGAESVGRFFAATAGVDVVVVPENDEVSRRAFCRSRLAIPRV